MSKLKQILTTLVPALLLTLNFPAYATWSIIAVDRDTGEIGIGGASCTFDVSGVASLVPGKGAIVVQAASHYFARMDGVKHMSEDQSAASILSAMKASKYEPEKQQYGVILLKKGTQPVVYSGSEIKGWKGEKLDHDVAVLGNILVNEDVIDNAFSAYQQNKAAPFAQRMIRALKAGADAGGDSRCGAQAARSAFVMLYNQQTQAITKLSVFGTEANGSPAVTLLERKFALLHGD
ncbi:DUF1028 domain-containing protein [Alteromonas ponticola]|uniref:DUF1028 domain-containing protein n=1 Tax=Alteromonas ponticola TaxID=2720613 RepID=A0ABX1R7V7_9ALTE|nr:DUF1028 domain-containing protein [Alteromonas ponticola]NMH61318.1 DUF1028 domain-containing protein [Alteromonas ponticola]